LPASGKTTMAKKLQAADEPWVRINWDDMRLQDGMTPDKFDIKTEKQIQENSFLAARTFLLEGVNVVVDNTNLNPNTLEKWRRIAVECNAAWEPQRLHPTIQKCIERDEKREGAAQVGRAVIERMALLADLIPFRPYDQYVLVDLDGTLADCEARRQFISNGRRDWDNFEGRTLEDELRTPIANLVSILQMWGYRILIVSGRSISRAGKDTVKWLDLHRIRYDHIFMRAGGDNRPDEVVKKEILDHLPKERIAYVLDDRNKVVQMWRDNGLTCLQVAPGDF